VFDLADGLLGSGALIDPPRERMRRAAKRDHQRLIRRSSPMRRVRG
jgi:hypothetical protein